METLELLAAFICIILGLGTFYWFYLKRCYSYWERLGVIAVPGKNVMGSQGVIFSHKLHELELERYNKYGRLYGMYEGQKPGLTVADPELIKNILVKDFPIFPNRRQFTTGDEITNNMVSIVPGETWKRIRTIISPTFSTGRIKRVTSIILDSAETVCSNFKIAADSGKPVNIKRLFGAFTMDVIASSAFGTKIDSHNDPDNSFVTEAKKVFSGRLPLRFILFIIFPRLFRLLKLTIFDRSAMEFFRKVTVQIIEERKKSGITRNDFLQLMMEASELKNEKTKDDDDDEEIEQAQVKLTKSQRKMSEVEILAQCVIFFIAGYETTASTLSFASYLLALHPEIQERLIKEIDQKIEEHKGEITYEGIQSMKYLDQVVSETLRIFAPLSRLERQAEEDYELGDTGITIPKGMVVGIPAHAIHHDPEYYPDPEKFDPERFTAEAKAERNPYVYLPFGSGPRNCVGMRFALMEVKLCLAKVLSQFRLKRSPQTKVPLDFFNGQGLLLVKEVTLDIEERKDRI